MLAPPLPRLANAKALAPILSWSSARKWPMPCIRALEAIKLQAGISERFNWLYESSAPEWLAELSPGVRRSEADIAQI